MFLKRIEIDGFKSFADKTVLNFETPITGIVGPNGCGKSNITDAIRWVLGEQSVSSLRADKGMASIIFSGSDSRRTINYAEVSLVFDNSKRYLPREEDEVIITRRITRKDNSSEYFINRQPARLRDVLDLTMDSGLARDSLSVISQGNISDFADAKPEARRQVFEEAAGVSKYKKKKNEAMNKLVRTQDNLDRAADIMNELEQQVLPLANAAKKAQRYTEIKEKLEAIETSVLVQDIEFYQEKLDESNKSAFDLETEIAVGETSLQVNENSINERRETLRELDRSIDADQEKLVRVVNSIQEMETRRVEINERRKYAMESADPAEREKELRNALRDAKTEYETRKASYDKMMSDIDLLEQQHTNTVLKRIDIEQNYQQTSGALNRLKNRKDVLENMMARPFSQQAGVQAVMDAIASLPGVLGVVAQEFKTEEGYEEAVSVALQGALYNIVTKDADSARGAIDFLKRNESGRATFLPRNILNPRYIREEDEIVASNQPGFLAIACDVVECNKMFEVVRDYLLGSIIVVDNLKNATQIADILKYRYNVVTLDGEIVHRGGSMTGGKQKQQVNYMTLNKEMNRINKDIDAQSLKAKELETQLSSLNHDRDTIEAKMWEARVNAAKLEPLLAVKKSAYESLQADYQLIKPEEGDKENTADEMLLLLEKSRQQKEELETAIRLNRESRFKLNSEIERKEVQLRQYRREVNENKDKLNNIKIDIARVELVLNQTLERLATEYHMTYEFAKDRVSKEVVENAKTEVADLRRKLASLGNVNLDAPQEYEEKSRRYDELKKNYDELMESREKLLSTIKEMDEIMNEKFADMFEKINLEFNYVFRQLFEGGNARLYLEDPNDLMNTGIEIEAHPPGKVIRNNRVLSGGEKTLIAFAVLFAILRARPIPLCIFDEVDTALDPANNDRFANYIKAISKESQFIVVTHHPSTMSKCDMLYGVTMAKNGVSDILKVQLDEAKELYGDE
mgnify:CR=1 FL=1